MFENEEINSVETDATPNDQSSNIESTPTPNTEITRQEFTPNKQPDMTPKDPELETNVKNVYADEFKQHGIDKHPVFKVEWDDFIRNQRADRRRLRFKSGTSVQQYHSKTRYRSPFYIKAKDKNGQWYERKIK